MWKQISFYHEISDSGEIRLYRDYGVYKKGYVLTPQLTHKGYLRVRICGKQWFVHRLVAIMFLGIEFGKEINHINGIRTDNRVENLEWVSCKENHIHCRDNLLPKYCKINKEIAVLIRKEKGLSHREIGLKYGLKHTQVGYILQNKRWAE